MTTSILWEAPGGYFNQPSPPLFHCCTPALIAVDNNDLRMRCACGAIYILGGWIEKNSHRFGVHHRWWMPWR